MELNIAKELAKRNVAKLIATESKHIDYAYTVQMADKYKKIITGKNIDSLLLQFVQRESAELFAQRVRLTKSITPAVANTIKAPFYKVTRNKKVNKSVSIDNETAKLSVETMINNFYGDPKKKNSGLNGFMQSRFVDYTFTDPNAWLVVEWMKVQDSEVPKPNPFIVSSSEAVNFKVENNIVEWLLVKNEIKYLKRDGKDSNGGLRYKELDGFKYTMYDKNYTIVYTQVDKDYQPKLDEVIEQIAKVFYIVDVYETKLEFAPAFRIGYDRDLHTNGRTFQNPFEVAMPYFEKMIERVSELDLTMRLHVFPQKYQYVQKCEGVSKEKKCSGGKCVDGSVCASCKGDGYKVHTTAQDIVLLPMPASKEEMLDLSKLIHYSAPPSDIINIQREYLKDLKNDVREAVFNTDVFNQTSIAKTATEHAIDFESVYDVLSPFANKYSDLWKDIVSVFVRLANVDLMNTQITHSFPTDLKLKTTAMLLGELKAINDSQAPSFLRDNVNEDIAEILYNDNELLMQKHKVKKSFYPFNGKSFDEIALATTSEYVPKFDKVLYFNFEKIFAELDKDDKTFWLKKYNEQWKIVGEKVNKIIDEMATNDAVKFTVSDLTGVNSSTGKSNQKTPTIDNIGNNGNGK
jgi:hypothetical protein